MENTGTNGRALIQKLKQHGYIGRSARGEMSEGHLSNVLKRSRRCSLVLAVALHEITGVPIRALVAWPTTPKAVRRPRTIPAPAQTEATV